MIIFNDIGYFGDGLIFSISVKRSTKYHTTVVLRFVRLLVMFCKRYDRMKSLTDILL